MVLRGSSRDRLKGTVNHETEPVSPMLPRLTVPRLRYVPPHCWGNRKSCSAARPPEVKGKAGALNPTSLPLFPICPSRRTEADDGLEGGRWMEVVNRQKEQESRRERVRERCMAAHIASDRMTDEGIMGQGYFPQ